MIDITNELIYEVLKDIQGKLKKLPANAPTDFVPRKLRRLLKDQEGNIKRNAWEMGLALAIKDALRSGNLHRRSNNWIRSIN